MPETAKAPTDTSHDTSHDWAPVHPLAALAAAPQRAADTAGVFLTPIVPAHTTLFVARQDAQEDAAEAIAAAIGVAPPPPGRVARGGNAELIWTAPGQWLLVSHEPGAAPAIDADLVSASDQTGARVLVRIDGPHAREALAKMLTIDLHPRAFPPDGAATTSAAGLGIVIWRAGDAFVLASGRSTAADLWRRLTAACAQYG